MAIIWFSDEDRERMRAERDEERARAEREVLFHEFLGEEYPDGIGTRHEVRVDIHETGQLDIRPWPEQPGAD